MKQFSCIDMGNNCNTVLIAPTEERLTEMASLHMREVHGRISISQEQVAEIKKLFTTRDAADAASVVDRIFEKYNCDREPECSWRYIAEAEVILTGSERVHAQDLRAA